MLCMARYEVQHMKGADVQGLDIGYKRAEREGRSCSDYGDDVADVDHHAASPPGWVQPVIYSLWSATFCLVRAMLPMHHLILRICIQQKLMAEAPSVR